MNNLKCLRRNCNRNAEFVILLGECDMYVCKKHLEVALKEFGKHPVISINSYKNFLKGGKK